jgi:hypothetical protein
MADRPDGIAEYLEDARTDWELSQRYKNVRIHCEKYGHGSLPKKDIWICTQCEKLEIIKELEQLTTHIQDIMDKCTQCEKLEIIKEFEQLTTHIQDFMNK